jgi:hypothetical protein
MEIRRKAEARSRAAMQIRRGAERCKSACRVEARARSEHVLISCRLCAGFPAACRQGRGPLALTGMLTCVLRVQSLAPALTSSSTFGRLVQVRSAWKLVCIFFIPSRTPYVWPAARRAHSSFPGTASYVCIGAADVPSSG